MSDVVNTLSRRHYANAKSKNSLIRRLWSQYVALVPKFLHRQPTYPQYTPDEPSFSLTGVSTYFLQIAWDQTRNFIFRIFRLRTPNSVYN